MAAATLENAHKLDIGSWGNWSFNATQYVPSAKDLALAGPRMFMKLGSMLTFPEAVDNILGGGRFGGRIIPEATGAGIVDAVTTAAAGGLGTQAIQAGTQILIEVEEPMGGVTSRFTLEGVRSISNVFSYATSKWALGCVMVAIILNRTYVYGSTRRNLVLPWKVRFVLRIIPIMLLAVQARSLLQSIQCQTSPDFGLLRWGNASKTSELMFTQNGGFLHEFSQTLLFRASDEDSCLAVRMIAPEYDEEIAKSTPNGKMPPSDLKGSLSLLWPLFKSFSFSQFVETISCAVQGRQVAGETGMTLFEHSLAFAEAEAAIGNQLGFGSFGNTNTLRWANSTSTAEATEIAITRSMILKKVNTTPEVLLVGFLSAMNHLTSHILAIFNAQGRFRLANTGFWGLSFMAAIVISVWNFSLDDELGTQSLLRFPTVCIIGFIPHVMVLAGIIGCSFIYVTALALSALAPPRVEEAQDEGVPVNQSTFMRRFIAAHNNMQANVQLSSIRVTLHMDFYTALLRTGFSVMTMASEAVYLNESRGVSIKQRTWLEEDRLREIEQVGAQWLGPSFRIHDPDSSLADGLTDNIGLVAANDQPMDLLQQSSSGYAREMTAKKLPKLGKPRDGRGPGLNGVGATERSGRWVMALEFFLGISRLLLSWWASLALKCLSGAGFSTRPRLLVWMVQMPKAKQAEKKRPDSTDPDSLNFYLLSIDGELTLPRDEHVDVEVEMRDRLRRQRGEWNETEEKNLDSNLYSWWLNGGWWGADDGSGHYNPEQKDLDEDTTSVVSFSTTTTDNEQDWLSDSENDDGRRTPTQRYPDFSRESTPFNDTPLNSADLAQLLHPKTPEQRAEAEALAAHFSSDNIVTRSRYRNIVQRERAKVLTSTRDRPQNFKASSPSGQLTPEEEAQILEHLIISRRAFQHATLTPQATSWARGASGMGEGGPQCVVCQSSPRSIIVWPCRCLSLCDDCRVTLAMNNFDKCVCCRRDVASFSRIFVP
ncbi:probable ASI3 Putative integral membrane E3 ubiquitin ligase, role in negative regulation of amino acid uptake [Phialocephala subalpina]|uniref:Probable ASI3 Putative integral membrane E3 ubiquitin ligase, role in negative regulation of amino acid uptake n=1 Tax=Phialocephala subalpina TaxID=576137 RepID=A0A1L7XDQ6_9HELO|nr:probable ASI3 Putative integral membrane E3 ubiquitin ligase, role in negative regulation of amino acid uptake [Phialocephala subalpina]